MPAPAPPESPASLPPASLPPASVPPASLGVRLWRVGQQFLRFGLVGLVGYAVDVAVLRLGLLAGLGLYAARVPSFVAAASATWWLNRRYTFRASPGALGGSAGRQWAVFVVAMLPGMALNYGTYAALVSQVAFCARWPEVAVFAGALAGMGANFAVSKYYIFKD